MNNLVKVRINKSGSLLVMIFAGMSVFKGLMLFGSILNAFILQLPQNGFGFTVTMNILVFVIVPLEIILSVIAAFWLFRRICKPTFNGYHQAIFAVNSVVVLLFSGFFLGKVGSDQIVTDLISGIVLVFAPILFSKLFKTSGDSLGLNK